MQAKEARHEKFNHAQGNHRKASEESLNSATTEHRIEPENIISVIFQPANHLAIGDFEAKYRVIYRA